MLLLLCVSLWGCYLVRWLSVLLIEVQAIAGDMRLFDVGHCIGEADSQHAYFMQSASLLRLCYTSPAERRLLQGSSKRRTMAC